MAVLLQHTDTKLFFKNEQQWVADPKEAQQFPTALNAFLVSIHHDALCCEVVEPEPQENPTCDSIQGA